jgi:hypothetical protein
VSSLHFPLQWNRRLAIVYSKLLKAKRAGMAELADALDLGSNAQKACRFKSCSRHQTLSLAAISTSVNRANI